MIHVLFMIVCLHPNVGCVVGTKDYHSDAACAQALPGEVAALEGKGYYVKAKCVQGEGTAL